MDWVRTRLSTGTLKKPACHHEKSVDVQSGLLFITLTLNRRIVQVHCDYMVDALLDSNQFAAPKKCKSHERLTAVSRVRAVSLAIGGRKGQRWKTGYAAKSGRTCDGRARLIFLVLTSIRILRAWKGCQISNATVTARDAIHYGRDTTSRRILASTDHDQKLLKFVRSRLKRVRGMY